MTADVATPLHCLERLGTRLRLDLRVKRDDLFPLFCGGNKARKVGFILAEAEKQGATAVVTNGGLQSNHARVVALAAASRGWACRLVLHGHAGAEPKGNHLIALMVGAHVGIVAAEAIAPAIEQACADLAREGHRPFVIPGGGHCLAGALAYREAMHEVSHQCAGGWMPDWIILASGTGTTQAGIVVGASELGWTTQHVVGISVARPGPRGRAAVTEAAEELARHVMFGGRLPAVDFRDDWTCGGYERSNRRVHEAIKAVARAEGLPLDPTYTGKAFAALLDLVESGEIPPGSRVLFWHTGGLVNLLTSDQARRQSLIS